MTLTAPIQRMSLDVIEGVAFLRLQGDIDLANADNLRVLGDDAISDYVGTIRIDLSDVTFLDSSGLNILVRIRNNADAAGRVLILEHPSPFVTRVLEIAGLIQAFTIEN